MDSFIWGIVVCWIILYVFIWSQLLVQGTLLRARDDKGHKDCAPCSGAAYCPIKGMKCTQDNNTYKEPCEPYGQERI